MAKPDLREYFGLQGNRHLADEPEGFACEHLGMDAATLYRAIAEAGLSCLRMSPDDLEERHYCARENWFYVYDKKDMQAFLDQHKETLMKAKWPTQADEFVFRMSYVTAPAQTALFDLIHDCYGGDSRHGDNGWLRANKNVTPKHEVEGQRESAAISLQRYKAIYHDDPAAAQFLLKLANQGYPGCMYDVSRLYKMGRGFKKDTVEAAFWYELVEERMRGKWQEPISAYTFHRNKPAHFPLTEEQQAAIQKRIAAWQPAPPPEEKTAIAQRKPIGTKSTKKHPKAL